MTKLHLAAVLVLVSLLSYFLSLFLAAFISRGVLEFSEETVYLPLAGVIFIGVLGWLVRSGFRFSLAPADPLTPADGTAWQIFKNEWQENRRDLMRVMAGTAVLFTL
ncbi:MAG: hypothetical protein K8I82_25280, partial [Anaerolineae bacterium]|nr:hypothetical protein [Anaerolineae bacterium]